MLGRTWLHAGKITTCPPISPLPPGPFQTQTLSQTQDELSQASLTMALLIWLSMPSLFLALLWPLLLGQRTRGLHAG